MIKLNVVAWIALLLVVIGALNWGLVGVFNGFDLVAAIFGEMSLIARIVYVLVGIAALYILIAALSVPKLPGHEAGRRQPA